jgi:hypothetical protein
MHYVAGPEPMLSPTFRANALSERQKLADRYLDCRRIHDEHMALAGAAALEAERYLRTIRELGELLGVEDQLSIVELTPELRGERLRQVAADIVFRHFQPGEEFHYRQWFDVLVSEGHRVGGKNAAATFLTQIAQIDGVERVGRRTGIYRISRSAA